MKIENVLTEMLGVEVPIIQGAFGPRGMGTSAIAVPVSEAGGLGVLTSICYAGPDEFQEDIRKTKAETDKPFAVNFTVFKEGPGDNSFHEEYVKIALQEGVETIFTSAYDGSAIGKRVKKEGCNWIHKCATLEHAVSTAKKGADAVVIVGVEGAGIKNPNQCSTLMNVTAGRRLFDTPIIAAGGIGDAHGFVSALAMGAVGVYLGTAFMATQEFKITEKLKNRIKDQDILDTDTRNKTLKGEHSRSNNPSLASGVIDSIPTVKEFMEEMISGAERIMTEFKQMGLVQGD